MSKVLLENIFKKYGDVEAVKDLNIEVKDKEFLVLVGPSGCGKSTALRMIAGLEDITSGDLFIGETRMNDVSPKDRDIAMVFQSYALYPHMTVYDNLAFGLRLRKNIPGIDIPHTKNGHFGGAIDSNGSTPQTEAHAETETVQPRSANMLANRRNREAAIRKRVEQVADGIGLRQYLSRKPAQLSGGQRQRVALGRAIVREPQVFLMDEPLSNLDAKMRVSTRAELQRLHRRLGVTTIYVTHDQVEAMTMGDRIAVMKDGVLQQIDTPKKLYAHPVNVFVAGFIGSPAMNLMRVDVQGESDGLFLKGPGFRVRVPEPLALRLAFKAGQPIIMGLRPEHIHDARFHRDADPETMVIGQFDAHESLGRDVFLYMTAGEQAFVARVDDRTDVTHGQDLKMVFDTSQIHAFDPETQNSLF